MKVVALFLFSCQIFPVTLGQTLFIFIPEPDVDIKPFTVTKDGEIDEVFGEFIVATLESELTSINKIYNFPTDKLNSEINRNLHIVFPGSTVMSYSKGEKFREYELELKKGIDIAELEELSIKFGKINFPFAKFILSVKNLFISNRNEVSGTIVIQDDLFEIISKIKTRKGIVEYWKFSSKDFNLSGNSVKKRDFVYYEKIVKKLAIFIYKKILEEKEDRFKILNYNEFEKFTYGLKKLYYFLEINKKERYLKEAKNLFSNITSVPS